MSCGMRVSEIATLMSADEFYASLVRLHQLDIVDQRHKAEAANENDSNALKKAPTEVAS